MNVEKSKLKTSDFLIEQAELFIDQMKSGKVGFFFSTETSVIENFFDFSDLRVSVSWKNPKTTKNKYFSFRTRCYEEFNSKSPEYRYFCPSLKGKIKFKIFKEEIKTLNLKIGHWEETFKVPDYLVQATRLIDKSLKEFNEKKILFYRSGPLKLNQDNFFVEKGMLMDDFKKESKNTEECKVLPLKPPKVIEKEEASTISSRVAFELEENIQQIKKLIKNSYE